jgi:hypothetical protein
METVIALGTVACNVARKFEKYTEYSVYKIDHEDSKEKKYLKIEKYGNPEEYEKSVPNVKQFLKSISGEVLFIVCGASKTSGASLVILEQIHKRCNINVLYIKAETDLLSERKTLQERATFGILQQYARSGLLERVYLVSNEHLDSLVEDASIMGYYDSLNEIVVSSFHMINFFNHVSSVADTFSDPLDTARISTFGLLNMDTGEEKLFFPLDNVRETRYYYGIPEKKLTEEKGLHRKIINQVKDKTCDDKKISYGIYSTNYKQGCAYVLSHSSHIQKS